VDHLILAMVSDIIIFGMLIAYHIKLPLELHSQADAVVPVLQGPKTEDYKFSPGAPRVRSYQYGDISIVASSATEFGVTRGLCVRVAQNDNFMPALYDLNYYRLQAANFASWYHDSGGNQGSGRRKRNDIS
jgi:hypothetical protein